jgi:hypothetical protein
MFIYTHKCHSDICHRGQNSDNTLSSLSWSPWRHFRPIVNCRLENVDVQRGKICWRFGSRTLNRYRSLISISLVSVWEVKFVLFNSMLKNVINRLMHAFFHIRTVIIPRPISTLGLKLSGRYRSLGMIGVLIWKRACKHIYLFVYCVQIPWKILHEGMPMFLAYCMLFSVLFYICLN